MNLRQVLETFRAYTANQEPAEMNSHYQASYELSSAICKALGLKRCTSLTLDLDFEGLPKVEAEIVVDGETAGEIRKIIEQYDLHPEKIEDVDDEDEEENLWDTEMTCDFCGSKDRVQIVGDGMQECAYCRGDDEPITKKQWEAWQIMVYSGVGMLLCILTASAIELWK